MERIQEAKTGRSSSQRVGHPTRTGDGDTARAGSPTSFERNLGSRVEPGGNDAPISDILEREKGGKEPRDKRKREPKPSRPDGQVPTSQGHAQTNPTHTQGRRFGRGSTPHLTSSSSLPPHCLLRENRNKAREQTRGSSRRACNFFLFGPISQAREAAPPPPHVLTTSRPSMARPPLIETAVVYCGQHQIEEPARPSTLASRHGLPSRGPPAT